MTRLGFTLISKACKGFTLIELLIVIAVLGVLAAGVLVAINPGEQLARARDSSRKTTLGQLSRAMQAFYTSRGGYVAPPGGGNLNWIDTLVSAGELKSVPPLVSYSTGVSACANSYNGFCYNAAGGTYGQHNWTAAAIWVRLESKSENSKCPAATPNASFLWASEQGRTGVVCHSSTEPSQVSGYTFLE